MNDIQIFNNPQFGEIRIIADNYDKPLFCLADVCKVLDLSNPTMVKSRLREDDLSSAEVIDEMGRRQTATFVGEKNLYRCIFQSRKDEAEKFQDWIFDEVLPSIRRTGTYSVPSAEIQGNHHLQQAQTQVFLIEQISRNLRLNDASRLGMYQELAEQHNLSIPAYVKSRGVHKSAKDLLKEIGSDISAIKFNLLLERNGFIESKSRPTTGGKEKKFWSITEKGSDYGENCVNPRNQNETQPHWYEDRFRELYGIVTDE